MRKLAIFTFLFCLLALTGIASAAGSATFSVSNITRDQAVRVLTISWIGDASDGTVPSYSSDNVENGSGNSIPGGMGPTLTNAIKGYYILVTETEPGSPAPTSYGATWKNALGLDFLLGKVTSRSTSAPEQVNCQSNMPIPGAMTFLLNSQSTNSAKGTMTIYLLFSGSTMPTVP